MPVTSFTPCRVTIACQKIPQQPKKANDIAPDVKAFLDYMNGLPAAGDFIKEIAQNLLFPHVYMNII